MICCGEEMRHTALGYYLCEKCGNQVKDELGIIKEALEKHPGANAIKLVELTGLPSSVIMKFLNDGTLTPTKKDRSFRAYYVGKPSSAARWRFFASSRKN